MNRAGVEHWVAGYERAWRTAGTDDLKQLFTADATYRMHPYADAADGLDAIARLWDDERDGPEEAFDMTSEILAVDGDTAIVRVEVRYGEPLHREFRDLWILRFDLLGRCTAFEEWAMSPPG